MTALPPDEVPTPTESTEARVPDAKPQSCPCCIADRKAKKAEARQESLVNPRRK